MCVCMCVSEEKIGKSVGHWWTSQHCQAGVWDCDMHLKEQQQQQLQNQKIFSVQPPVFLHSFKPQRNWLQNPRQELWVPGTPPSSPGSRKTPPQYNLAGTKLNSPNSFCLNDKCLS